MLHQELIGHAAGGNAILYRSISANRTTKYDLFVDCGSPTFPCDVYVTVESGVEVYASNGTQEGFSTGTGWVAGSNLYLINLGYIMGRGGAGGAGGAATAAGDPGGNGMNAIELGYNLTITNANGYIIGGGPGGGGGGGGPSSQTGGGGGGGAPYGPGGSGVNNGADATLGTEGTAGAGAVDFGGSSGAGGNGGPQANNANNGSAGVGGSAGAGGAAGSTIGKAINLNGYTATFVNGNDGTHVKGAVS
jgi:hypothetical protein